MTPTPRTTLVGVFEDRLAAERAVDELERANFKGDQVGYALRGSGDPEQRGMISDADGTKDKRGAIAGAATGAGLGAILGAAAAILIPGFGPVVAGGILAMAFGGAIAGTAVGGIFGAMTGLHFRGRSASTRTRIQLRPRHRGREGRPACCGGRGNHAAPRRL